jgi:hypothetical protein
LADLWLDEFPQPETFLPALQAAREKASEVAREGAGPGSLSDEGLRYAVLDGVAIDEHLPWLRTAYERSFLQLARSMSALPLKLSPDRRSSVNVNYLDPGGSYEPHTDAQPYTMIWFPHSLRERDGGALVIEEARLSPRRGGVVLFDGSALAHRVEATRLPRITVPMVYLPQDADLLRPEGLDDHLF